jgi:effector-binding domain-containing protein
MKALKIIGGVLVVLVLAIVALGFLGPKQVHLERSIEIDAPADFVFDHANTFDKNQKWSPWEKKDPNMTKTIDGTDGTVGAVYSWKGNDQVGEGSQTILEIGDNKMITELNLMSIAKVTFMVNEADGKTIAKWSYDEETDFMMRAMYMLGDIEDFIGPDFEQGMTNLKKLVEANKAEKKEFNGHKVSTIDLPATTYLGKRKLITWAEMGLFFEKSYAEVYGQLGKAGIEPAGDPAAIYYTWDEENQRSDAMACVPVAEGSMVDGLSMQVVSGKALQIEYVGNYEGSGAAHEAMEKYMHWHNIEFGGFALEIYVVGPMSQADPAKYETRIIYPIK